MRTLLLTSAYHPHKGGVEEIVRQLAREYRRCGHQALIVTPRWPRTLPASEMVEDQLVLRVPMPLPSRSHPRSMASFLFRFLPSVARMLYIGWRWRPDLLHINCAGPNGLYGLILAQALSLPTVVTSYGEQTVDAGRLYERSATMRWTLRRLLHGADAVTADSANALANLALYGFAPAAGIVMHNGIDLEEFTQAAPTSSHERPYIFALGRHVTTKGFDVLLRAYAQLAPRFPDVDLVIAGDGPERQRLVTLAGELGLQDRVIFPGRTDRTRTVQYFAHARLFVLPSLRESFPVVNLEAMAAGRPVVVTNVGGVAELVRDGQNGLVVPSADPAALAGALERLLDDPPFAAMLAEAGARYVRAERTWEKVAASYLALYEDVIARRHAATQSPTISIAAEQ